MFYTILDDILILYQLLTIKPSKYTNYELNLYKYFYDKTKIIPSYIIIIKIEDDEFIFLFVKQDKYFEARTYLNSLRHRIVKKISIIRFDNILLNLLFNLFPDLCIHDIKIAINNIKGKYEISICFLKDLNTYHIAVGRRGKYIKAVNVLFDKHINFYTDNIPLTIKCKAVD
ncbi:MAG: hypothetical protein HWN81_16805 [Candidatus Lokiarchaeota archaeon]|nr:hypothetical protein [Candidatus Lokiarchaeota archaeon]